jgi:ABC-type dipeptide/oligopeptide/nickel transport system ATPase component
MSPLLEADISVDYPGKPGVLRDFRLAVARGEIFGLAGQSGSGKSTFSLAVLGLLDEKNGKDAKVSGSILFDGQDLLKCSERGLRQIRGKRISLVPQSPLASLNPRLRLGTQFEEAWTVHRLDARREWRQQAIEALEAASLPSPSDLLGRYPRELSVGMAQRVMIAMALLHRPQLMIADEATSALDLITQAEILALFRTLRDRYGVSIFFITHDLAAAGSVCDRMAVLEKGQIVECGETARVLHSPSHPYTRRLVAALPGFAGVAR